MVEDKDYIMRLAHEIVRTLAKLLFGKDFDKDEVQLSEEAARLYSQLTELLEQGEIDRAEDLLLEEIDANRLEDFEVALRFYYKLNEKSDEFLQSHDFSREEIIDGVRYAAGFFGYGNLMEAFAAELEGV